MCVIKNLCSDDASHPLFWLIKFMGFYEGTSDHIICNDIHEKMKNSWLHIVEYFQYWGLSTYMELQTSMTGFTSRCILCNQDRIKMMKRNRMIFSMDQRNRTSWASIISTDWNSQVNSLDLSQKKHFRWILFTVLHSQTVQHWLLTLKERPVMWERFFPRLPLSMISCR